MRASISWFLTFLGRHVFSIFLVKNLIKVSWLVAPSLFYKNDKSPGSSLRRVDFSHMFFHVFVVFYISSVDFFTYASTRWFFYMCASIRWFLWSYFQYVSVSFDISNKSPGSRSSAFWYMYVYIYIHIYTYIHIYIYADINKSQLARGAPRRRGPRRTRPEAHGVDRSSRSERDRETLIYIYIYIYMKRERAKHTLLRNAI